LANATARILTVGPIQRLFGIIGAALLLILAIAIARRASAGPLPVAAMPAWLIVHLLTVAPALAIGTWLMLRPKGTPLHRQLGKIWCGLMFVTALSSFGTLAGPGGHLSWIHIFSIATLIGVPRVILFARTHRVELHRRTVTLVYGGLVGAGIFVFLPFRMLGQWLLG
jgi:uncharacterized membrane protein